MRPADGLMAPDENTATLGTPKFTALVMLKNSARNSTRALSVTGVVLKSEKSKSAMPGPLITPRPELPQVPAVGRLKALGLNHWLTVWGSALPWKFGFKLGRSGFLASPFPDWLDPTSGVTGKPLSTVRMPFICQPLSNLSETPCNRVSH